MVRVFICYQREDDEITGRLADFLIARLGRQSVFMDVESIPLGADWRAFIAEAVTGADVMLAVIGPNWSGPGPAGQRRIDRPDDSVRLEIEAAFSRDMPVIPVLVGEATMPRETELPPGLKPLAYRNAAIVRTDPHFHQDAERVVRALRRLLPDAGPLATSPSDLVAHKPRVFVSYAPRDHSFVASEIIGPLTRNGIECLSGSTGVTTTVRWDRLARENLEACDWFLVVLTRYSTSSRLISNEVSWAFEARPGRIIPVLAEDCDPQDFHLGLAGLTYIDFRHDLEAARRRLLAIWDVGEAVNPYVVGKPVQGELFVGRRDILRMVEDNLGPSAGKNILVLRGQRRTGKTSVLLRLRETLAATSKGAYLPVFVDLQGMMNVTGEGPFLHYLAHHIWKDLGQHGVRVDRPALANFVQAPANAFEFDFLGAVEAALGERRILLMLDEFEKVKELIDRGSLGSDLLGYCRHLMQHSPLLFLIAGMQKLRELSGGYWSVFFNLALPIDIGALTEPEARRLIMDPVRTWYRIEPDAIGEIIRVGGCHPYFTQLVCKTLLEVRNEARLRVLTVEHVREAVDRALQSGDEQIGYPWTEEDCTPDERLVLAALARRAGADGPVPLGTLRADLDAAGVGAALGAAAGRLQTRGVVRQEGGGVSFLVPLFQTWMVRKSYDSLEAASQYNREREPTGGLPPPSQPLHQPPGN